MRRLTITLTLLALVLGACQKSSDKKEESAKNAAAGKVEFSAGGPGLLKILGAEKAMADEGQTARKKAAPFDATAVKTAPIVRRIRDQLDDRIPAGAELSISDIQPLEAPNMAKGMLQVRTTQGSGSMPLYFSIDGKWVTVGPLFEVGEPQPAPVEGFQIVPLRSFDQNDVQELWVSADGKIATLGGFLDTSVNPAAERMKQVALEGRPSRGKEGAKVVMVEFSDFQCPFCARSAQMINSRLYPEYKDKVEFRFKHLPLSFHKWAEPAAHASYCIHDQNEEGFWTAYDYFFENQRAINPANIEDHARRVAEKVGINLDEFMKCYNTRKFAEKIRRDMEDANELGFDGTPAFLINGQRVRGAQDYSTFKQAIEAELARE